MEYKSVLFEIKDMSKDSRTAIIAHAVYNSIDRVGDISTKGMFNKSWSEKKSIDFLFNHDRTKVVGNVLRTFEDENKAYTEVKFGAWTLGDDVMNMAEAGVLRGASFGYITERKDFVKVGQRNVRKLIEVKHNETSLLTNDPAHPEAGIVSLTKAEDIQNFIIEMKSHIVTMETFCRNTNASDETIKAIYAEVKQAYDLLSKYDTSSTQVAPAPDASRNDGNSFYKQLLLLNAKI